MWKGIQKWEISYLIRWSKIARRLYRSMTRSETRLSCSMNRVKRDREWVSELSNDTLQGIQRIRPFSKKDSYLLPPYTGIYTGQLTNGLEDRPWPGRQGFNPWSNHTKKLKQLYLMPPCLKLSIIRYVSRVKRCRPRKGVAPCPTTRCSS